MLSKVEVLNGIPTITVNGKPLCEMAYITYPPQHHKKGECFLFERKEVPK